MAKKQQSQLKELLEALEKAIKDADKNLELYKECEINSE